VTALDTQLSVFSAEIVCVDGNDDFCSGKSQVAWSSKQDEIYFILVHGKDGAEGTFILQVTTEGESLADADFCANAKSVEIGTTGPVDLSHATADPDMLNCSKAFWVIGTTVVGNFYTFVGPGDLVSISMAATSEFTPLLATINPVLLTGASCGTLECISACEGSSCQVYTIPGQHYYVYVYYIEEVLQESERNWLNGGVNLTIRQGA
jgi:hypothetical protein